MKCTIPGRGIRALGKAIQCLAKIGDELYIEAETDGLALKTVNGARSAYVCFLFQRSFFHSYSDRRTGARDRRGGEGEEEEEEEALKCKITIKSILSVFRVLSTLEKSVDHCRLYLDPEENKLVFVFHCRHGIVKTHHLGFQECEALQAVFTKELCPNHIAGPARILSEVVTNFPTSLEEVTLMAEPERAQLRNYVEDEGDGTRVPLTEICLLPAEFDEYQIGVDASVTFCLKELRAILLFTDAINHSLSLRFETAGKPIVFSLDDCNEYRADFVLATLVDASASHTSLAHATNTAAAAAAKKRVQNGFHHEGKAATHGVHVDDEDNSLGDFTHAHIPPVPCAKRGMRAGSEGQPSTHESHSNRTSVAGTSASSSSNSRNNMSSASNSGGTCVPKPPQAAIKASEYQDPFPRTNPRSHDVSHGISRGDFAAIGEDYDVMDALFETENMNDVAEDEGMFGFDCEGVGTKGKEKASTGGQRTKKQGGGGDQLEKRKEIGKGTGGSSHMHDVEFFSDDFPYEDMYVKTVRKSTTADASGTLVTTSDQPRDHTVSSGNHATSAVQLSGHTASVAIQEGPDLMQTDQNVTQDSIIDDSGFLPSTPPAKKFKSILFGVDIFGNRINKSEILAPDSDEESDC